jgi:hypothetical protein
LRPIIVLLTLLFLLAGCTQSQPTATSSTPMPSDLTPLFDRILERVSDIRGLDPLRAVTPKFMTREELANTLREDLYENSEDIWNSQNVMKIMELIPQNSNLHELLLSLYSEQVLGLYDTETEELYVIKGMTELTPLDELTLAHEYTHALQQQHFDIHAMSEAVADDSEAGSALSALIEGDATAVQIEYMRRYLTSEQQEKIFSNSVDSQIFNASPYVLQESLNFPYRDGLMLVNNLLLVGQWESVNDAYRRPPASTEQVLHFSKYQDGENPTTISLPDVSTALGQDWEMVHEDVLGEFFLKIYLETRTVDPVPSRAVEGWGGDLFNIMAGPNGEQAMVALLAWDSERDAQQFFDAIIWRLSVPENVIWRISGDRVLWVLSPSRGTTEEIASLFPDF